MKYVDLAIDNKTDSTDILFTYGAKDDEIKVGQKVYVKFARRKDLVAGYVFDVYDEPRQKFCNFRYIEKIDEDVSLTDEMVRTCKWMKKRYLCRYIDAVSLFTPVGQPLKSGKLRKPLQGKAGEPQPITELTKEQNDVIKGILETKDHEISLIHGVTGSGKTEVYMRLIEQVVKAGRGAIMMVPEISLTKQITDRFISRFGVQNLAILHSRLSPGERHDEWIKIRNGSVKVVIGARSAVFAPMEDIGIIIMDEEHEQTYKSEQTPKYDTVEVATKRTIDHDAKLVLGSATPSAISYRRSEDGLYRRFTMDKRYNAVELPDIEIIDMREELKKGNRSMFSENLKSAIACELEKQGQVILLLNRRGYATFISCRECGFVAKCPDCDISMTYHKDEQKIRCHYCGHSEDIPHICPVCGSGYIKYFGTGTQKIDEQIKELFPGANIARLDLDTMRHKGSTEKILDDFGSGKSDILVGTQVVAKGLDFKNVGLVGILSADTGLNIPDFRSAERTFELVMQAAGRAGRGEKKGKVLVQTYSPENYAIKAAARHDYGEFYEAEITYRRRRNYPPFSDFIRIVFQSVDQNKAVGMAEKWQHALQDMLGDEAGNVTGHDCMISLTKKEGYKECLLVKCPHGKRSAYFKMIQQLKDNRGSREKDIAISVDVNPYSMWRS